MEFGAHCLEVALEPEAIVKPLLRKVRRFADLRPAPEGRRNCSDCSLLDTLV